MDVFELLPIPYGWKIGGTGTCRILLHVVSGLAGSVVAGPSAHARDCLAAPYQWLGGWVGGWVAAWVGG